VIVEGAAEAEPTVADPTPTASLAAHNAAQRLDLGLDIASIKTGFMASLSTAVTITAAATASRFLIRFTSLFVGEMLPHVVDHGLPPWVGTGTLAR
jgi:hypothetical protein